MRASRQDGWRSHPIKTRMVKNAIKAVLCDPAMAERGLSRLSAAETVAEPAPAYTIDSETLAAQLLELVKSHHEY